MPGYTDRGMTRSGKSLSSNATIQADLMDENPEIEKCDRRDCFTYQQVYRKTRSQLNLEFVTSKLRLMADKKHTVHPIDNLVQTGRYDEAIDLSEKILNRNPRDHLARLKLAFILAGIDSIEDAVQQIGIAETLSNGKLDRLYLLKGRLEYYLGDKSYVNSFRKAIRLQPQQRQFVYYLADTELRGDYVILDELKLIYSPVPKSGTTTVKRILTDADLHGKRSAGRETVLGILKRLGIRGIVDPASSNKDRRKAHALLNNARFQKDRLRLGRCKLNKFYKFAIVRGDIERFESYARKNVIQAGSLLKPSGRQEEYFGLPTRPDLNFLARNLLKYQFLYLDVIHHTIPERAYLNKDLGFYDEVFDLKDIEKLQNQLITWLGIDMTFDQALRSGDKLRTLNLSATSRELLHSYYQHSLQ